MVPAGRSVLPDHWKDSTLRKQDNSLHSVNRILESFRFEYENEYEYKF